jgi:hypothetical protein
MEGLPWACAASPLRDHGISYLGCHWGRFIGGRFGLPLENKGRYRQSRHLNLTRSGIRSSCNGNCNRMGKRYAHRPATAASFARNAEQRLSEAGGRGGDAAAGTERKLLVVPSDVHRPPCALVWPGSAGDICNPDSPQPLVRLRVLLEAPDGRPRGLGEPPVGPIAPAVGNAFSSRSLRTDSSLPSCRPEGCDAQTNDIPLS